MEAIRNPKIDRATLRALAGDEAELVALLERHSGLPSSIGPTFRSKSAPKMSLDLPRAVGAAIARGSKKEADRLIRRLAEGQGEVGRVVAAMALATRHQLGIDTKGALDDLQVLAEDPRQLVRAGVVAAVRSLIAANGPELLASWTDGYLQAHVALEALADRQVLDAIPIAKEVIARLDEAFVLADQSPRSAERMQGMRLLRQALPQQIATFAARFSEVVAWLESKTSIARPESREVVAAAIRALEKRSLSYAGAGKLEASLAASAKPRRDAARVVTGTRRRGRGT